MPPRKKSYAIILALIGLLWGCGDKSDPGAAKDKLLKVPIAVATITQQPFLYEAVGTVEARTTSILSSKLMGTIKAVYVREGSMVNQGDVLVLIDAREVAAQFRKSKAALAEAKKAEASAKSAREAAKAGAELAGSTYNRYLKLMEEDSASKQEFEEIKARHRQAEASFAQAEAMVQAARYRVQQGEAAVASARVTKEDASVLAPYDGKVSAKMIDEGDLAVPGTPLLTLERQGIYCVVLVLPEEHIQSVRLKQKVNVRIPTLQGRPLEGVIERIDPAADPKSRSFRLRVALQEAEDVLSGMFARVEIPVGEAGILLVPSTAVVHEGQLTGIYMVDNQQIARFRLIRIGRLFGDFVEVLSGLKDGDRYVVVLPADLKDGAKVEVVS